MSAFLLNIMLLKFMMYDDKFMINFEIYDKFGHIIIFKKNEDHKLWKLSFFEIYGPTECYDYVVC